MQLYVIVQKNLPDHTVILAPGKLKQEDCHQFEVSLKYIVKGCDGSHSAEGIGT